MITSDYIGSKVSYDPDTGVFRYKKHYQKKREGTEAGFCTKWTLGYVKISIDGKMYLAHRLAFLLMEGRFPVHQVDHINGDRSDNRWCNLRDIPGVDNLKNSSIQKNNSTGITGVRFRKRYKPAGSWIAYIIVDGKHVQIGTYKDFFEAACARKSAEIEYGFHENHGKRIAKRYWRNETKTNGSRVRTARVQARAAAILAADTRSPALLGAAPCREVAA